MIAMKDRQHNNCSNIIIDLKIVTVGINFPNKGKRHFKKEKLK